MGQMNINITKVEVDEQNQSIQYYYSMGEIANYFLRIDKYRLINGTVSDDGKNYACGLPIEVIKYLIENFKEVNFHEMS